ncbi:MAG TPA: HipA family kinase [Candidatus Angelobacter sp.]
MATLDLKRSSFAPQATAMAAPLSAIQHIRKLRGGTQAHLMRGSDDNLYVVKFQTNPIHPRVLANEFLATRLGSWLGIPMPQVEVIEVSSWLIAHSPALLVELAESRIPCGSGLQLASRYVADPIYFEVLDQLSKVAFRKVVNKPDMVRALAFDKWVGNCDSRQVVFTRRVGQDQFQATLVDQSYCFDASKWDFPDLPFMGTCEHDHVYRNVTGWKSFEPILSRIEEIEYADLWSFAAEVPQEWYQYEAQALCRLIGTLYDRRSVVRDLITALRHSKPNLFPRWTR